MISCIMLNRRDGLFEGRGCVKKSDHDRRGRAATEYLEHLSSWRRTVKGIESTRNVPTRTLLRAVSARGLLASGDDKGSLLPRCGFDGRMVGITGFHDAKLTWNAHGHVQRWQRH
jgi:hypothetical protein